MFIVPPGLVTGGVSAIGVIIQHFVTLANPDFKIVDIVGLGLIILVSLLFLSNRWLHEEFFNKKKHPDMKWLDRVKAYFKKKR